jgi:protein ImuA
VVRAKKREEALWAAEQGLSVPGGVVLCSLGAQGKPLELKATRRLLLLAERHGSRCILIKPEDGATAAWTRWRIEAAPSEGEARELGPPRFRATLTRNRTGPSGRAYLLEWNAHARAFAECGAVAGDLAAASGDGSFATRQKRAV